jgi:hypothetical protein
MVTNLNLIRRTFAAAIDLKEQFDKKASSDSIEGYSRAFLNLFDHLQSVLPREIIESSKVDNEVYWIRRNPTNSYNNVRSICSNSIFRLEDAFIKYYYKNHNEEFLKYLEAKF